MLRIGGSRLSRPFAAAAAGLLLAGAYPPLEWSALAWLALVPLLWAVRDQPLRRAAGLGFLSGAVFWNLSLAWLRRVTVAGWIGLALYCALYLAVFAVFAAGWYRVADRAGGGPAWRVATLVAVTAAWVGLEHLRSVLFTGFPWNGLGVSQYRRVVLIQSAAWGGVFGVSALLVWVNAAVAETARRWGASRIGVGRAARVLPALEVVLAAAAVLAAVAGGRAALARLPAPARRVRLALVQPAIPQYVKWTDDFVDETYRRLESLSAAAAAVQPDLLVWPETAVPDVLRYSEEGYALVRRVTGLGLPLLVGALDAERRGGDDVDYFNTAFLIDADGRIEARYHKRHLVLFGEYVPFSDRFPWLRSLTPMESDVTPGTQPVIFRLPREDWTFGVLICFEDTVPGLSRDLAAAGADLLITLTNDAWFDFSSGSRQHLAQSVFRCVEQRRPMARCANSGITAWIDAAGRIGGAEGSAGVLPHYGPGPVALSGFLLAEVPMHDPLPPPTPYARYGDAFGRACAWLLLPLALPLVRRRRAGTGR